jgi:hypothetical protein
MRNIFLGTLALLLASTPVAVTAQAASQTVAQSGIFNGKRYSSVTFTIQSDGRYTITFHYDDGSQWTQGIADAGAFFGL